MIRSVGICVKEDQPQAEQTIAEMAHWLRGRGVTVLADADSAGFAGVEPLTREALAAEADLIVALGGDGTLLSVARASGTREVPILGVNLGRLGFLTEVNIDELFPTLDKLLAGEFEVVRRMRLEVIALRDGEEVGRFQALNDAVITKTALSRMIDLSARADGEEVTTYHADGLVVATPTGSTAYSLSAGGPLLVPGLEAIVLTPICPHSLTQRPLVVPQSTVIDISVHVPGGGGAVALTIDGQAGLELLDGDTVSLRRSEHPVTTIASPFRNRFQILHEKLRWGQR